MITKEEIIKKLHLQPHPTEGGYFIETYRSQETIKKNCLNNRYDSDRCFSTAIYFFLTKNTFSEMHKVNSDEIFHFYIGDPLELLHLYPDGSGEKIILGNDIANNMIPQVIIPQGVWQGARLVEGGEYALIGATVAPGFEYNDYESGKKDFLVKKYPDFKNLITILTNH